MKMGLNTDNEPEYSLYSEDRQNIQELHDLQKYTAYVQLLHPKPDRQNYIKNQDYQIGGHY